MTEFHIKVVERGGSKLSQLLANTNPWAGGNCGRQGCVTCEQGGDKLPPCTKRSILYESTCLDCNPQGERSVQKTASGVDLMETRPEASIYVGELASSIHERAAEHWRDYRERREDSHILKHWMNHHKGEGSPNFKFDVIKTFQDSLSRQVAEAVRVELRGKVLKSKKAFLIGAN